MYRTLGVLCVVFGLMLTTACFQDTQPFKQHEINLREARGGLLQTITTLPQDTDFQVVKAVSYELYDEEHGQGPVCYYARSYFIIGATIPLQDALAKYTQMLKGSGWVIRGEEYQTDNAFTRGIHERANLHSGSPGSELEATANLEELGKSYTSLFFLNVDYILPNEKRC